MKKEDLWLETGSIFFGEHKGAQSSFYRVRVTNGKKFFGELKGMTVENGYGADPLKAIEDFIRRNTSEVIEKVIN